MKNKAKSNIIHWNSSKCLTFSLQGVQGELFKITQIDYPFMITIFSPIQITDALTSYILWPFWFSKTRRHEADVSQPRPLVIDRSMYGLLFTVFWRGIMWFLVKIFLISTHVRISLALRSGKEVHRFIVLKKYFIAMAGLTEAQIQMIMCRYFIYAWRIGAEIQRKNDSPCAFEACRLEIYRSIPESHSVCKQVFYSYFVYMF